MRVVADTNTVISGLLWRGVPHQVLEAARSGQIDLYTTAVLLAELEDVLNRPRFASLLSRATVTPHELMWGYAALASLVTPAPIDPVIATDPDDDAVLACALAAQAQAIVSGDRHLLELQHYRMIPIMTPRTLLTTLSPPR